MTTEAYALIDVQLVLEAVNGLNVDDLIALPTDEALTAWAALEEANRILAGVRSQVMPRVAENMGEHQRVVDGVGTFVRHVKKDRTAWEKDDLLRAVLDSRLVDEKTGEVADETPLAKVLHVFNMPAPRTTALRARGIDADQFCHTERGGFTIEVLS